MKTLIISLFIAAIGHSQVYYTNTIQTGHQGSYYNEETNGQGINLEIIDSVDNRKVVMFFYTYDSLGNQRWLLGTGNVERKTNGSFAGDVVLDVLTTEGGAFLTPNSQAQSNTLNVGSAVLAVDNCDRITVDFLFDPTVGHTDRPYDASFEGLETTYAANRLTKSLGQCELECVQPTFSPSNPYCKRN